MTSDIKIIGKYKQMKTFETPEEFNKFYNKHKDEIDAKTTNQLNKELKIKGYKITKRNMKVIDGKKTGDLHLKPVGVSSSEVHNNDGASRLDPSGLGADIEQDLNELREEIEEMKGKINMLTESYSNVVEVLNALSASMSSGC